MNVNKRIYLKSKCKQKIYNTHLRYNETMMQVIKYDISKSHISGTKRLLQNLNSVLLRNIPFAIMEK